MRREVPVTLFGGLSGGRVDDSPARSGRALALACAFVAALVSACGGGGGGKTDDAGVFMDPDFSIAPSPTAVTIAAGQSGDVTVTANRMNGHTAPIVLTLNSPPAGISANATISASAASATLTVNVGVGTAGGVISLGLTGSDGLRSRGSTLTLTVLGPPVIISQPQNVSTVVGQTATFSVTAVGDPAPTFQWQRSDDSGGTWESVASGAGATSADYTTAPLSISDDGALFRVLVTSSAGYVASDSALLTVGQPPASPTGLTAAAGDGQVLLRWETIYGVNYNVYRRTTPGVTTADGPVLSNIGGPSVLVMGLTNGQPYYFAITGTSSEGLESGVSNEVAARPLAGATCPVTGPATRVTDVSFIASGSLEVPAGYTPTAVWFEYGTSAAYGSATTAQGYASPGSVTVPPETIRGLAPSTTYHWRLTTQDSGGTFSGADGTFTTYPSPQIVKTSVGDWYTLIGVDAGGIYYSYYSTATGTIFIEKTSLDGTATTPLVSAIVNNFLHFATDQGNIYCADFGAGEIFSVSKSGGPATPLVSGLVRPNAIQVNDTRIFWSEASDSSTSLKAIDLDGDPTSLSTLLTTTGTPVLDSYTVFGVDVSDVYYTHSVMGGATTIKKIGVDGGMVTTLVSGLGYSSSFTTDAGFVYYFARPSFNTMAIYKLGKSGGSPVPLASGMAFAPNSSPSFSNIALDATTAYWIGSASEYSALVSVGLAAGAAAIKTSEEKSYYSLFADATTLYWTAYDSAAGVGTIEKIAK